MRHIKGLYLEIVNRENMLLFIAFMTGFAVFNIIAKHRGAEENVFSLEYGFFFTAIYIIVHSAFKYKPKKIKEIEGEEK
ncbi:hypothetical protein [Billgrantia endophytica]|uniref:Uncharacterized protein n=1 Tax=Billgrantia endophytica TaxID=2033802 RepID=A0A2N7TUF7_9GAMM|nr:hypothetical protein [Halomonas endophytica]PMR71806.1 hypothetical protein C1H69_23005 [Halomonas endophytica]